MGLVPEVVVVFCFNGFDFAFDEYDFPYPDEVTFEYLFRRFELVDLSCDLSDALSEDPLSLLLFFSNFCNLGFGLREVVLATALVLFPGTGFLPNKRDLAVTLLTSFFSLGLLSFSFRRALFCCRLVLILLRLLTFSSFFFGLLFLRLSSETFFFTDGWALSFTNRVDFTFEVSATDVFRLINFFDLSVFSGGLLDFAKSLGELG
mmetsp:Transcript_27989/g.42903  ORF Transcript_27989/g.42903 Transcript_27989/m.42903 type:complete len:205 (+) Transcript_27989:358-972(+)